MRAAPYRPGRPPKPVGRIPATRAPSGWEREGDHDALGDIERRHDDRLRDGGRGPPVVLVATTLSDHHALAGLAGQLVPDFTVYNYDRRGRGGSGDTSPSAPQREVDDLAAILEAVGGGAALISGSAGCVLALDAASALGGRVTALYLYEPPFVVDAAAAMYHPDAAIVQIDEVHAGIRRHLAPPVLDPPLGEASHRRRSRSAAVTSSRRPPRVT